MDPWEVVRDLKDIKYLDTRIHAINESFGTAIDAVNSLLVSQQPPDDQQVTLLDDAQNAVYVYWMHMRNSLRSRDHVMPSPDKTKMLISNTLLPWLLMSKLYLFRVLYEYGIEEMMASEQAAYSIWKLQPFADFILSNQEGMVVCKTAPCKMSIKQIKSVFYVLTANWRNFHYAHHQRIYEYLELLIRRLFVLTALSAKRHAEFDITDRVSDALVYEFELHSHTLMYNFFVTTLFDAKPYCESPGFDNEQYVLTKARLERWLRIRMENGKFDRVRALFSSEMTNMAPRPTQRERIARIRGRKTELVSAREVLEDEEAQQNKLDEYLAQPNVVHRTLQGDTGTVFCRQYLFVMIMDFFLTNNFKWPFKRYSVYPEAGLSDSNRLVELSRTKSLPFLLGVCNTHMLVMDGCIYPVTHFLDAMTQFILATRSGDQALEFPGFYADFQDLHGYMPSDAELDSVSVDLGVYDLSFVDRRPAGFVSDSESDDEEPMQNEIIAGGPET